MHVIKSSSDDKNIGNNMVKARKYVVKKRFEGLPKRDDFEVVEYELPALRDGEILVKTELVSVDPYQRAYHHIYHVPYDQFGFQVGIVVDSKDPRYPVGRRVLTQRGWCDYFILNVEVPIPDIFDIPVQLLPDIKDLSPSVIFGAAGMSGATAYFGFLEICQPKAGETVVVTGAAGAIGSVVGQIAKIKGCKVIGFAGSDQKVELLENELKFDRAFNYKTVDVAKVLKDAAPEGVDCYFDNVGGEISSIIINNMNPFGRVSICGSISAYNNATLDSAKVSILQPDIVSKQLKLEGFILPRWLDRCPEAYSQLHKWILSGQLKVREHITEGFENMYNAFIGMLTGENIGKALVKI